MDFKIEALKHNLPGITKCCLRNVFITAIHKSACAVVIVRYKACKEHNGFIVIYMSCATGLVDFQTCMDGLSLTPHQLLNLFVYLDPLESGKVQVESIIGLIRRGSQVDRLTVQYLEAIFFYLCPSGSDEIDNTKLVTSCHVEHHRDVLSGRRTGVEVLMAVLMAVKDNERVALEDFLALNTYAQCTKWLVT